MQNVFCIGFSGKASPRGEALLLQENQREEAKLKKHKGYCVAVTAWHRVMAVP